VAQLAIELAHTAIRRASSLLSSLARAATGFAFIKDGAQLTVGVTHDETVRRYSGTVPESRTQQLRQLGDIRCNPPRNA